MKAPLLTDWDRTRAAAPRFLAILALVYVFACVAFACAASVALLVLDSNGPFPVWKLAVRSAIFGFATLGTLVLLWRVGRSPKLVQSIGIAAVPSGNNWALLSAALVFAATLVLPRLGAYPWTAPDEVHHLLVARNLAVEGVYASGHPATQLRQFDTYDSVGAPVIGPVAASFRLSGVGVVHARVVMAAFFLMLCAALYVLLRPLYGSSAAALGLMVMTTGWGSVYLGRTLYGEVPAFAFVAVGLWLWRIALRRPTVTISAALCGVAFGLAVLSKSILILCCFPLLGVLAYDRLTFRVIRWPHVVLPSVAAAGVVGAWWVVQTLGHHDVSGGAETTLAVYRHNLMFGLRSVPKALSAIPREPLTAIALLLGSFSVIPRIFARRYDPALAALFLIAAFFAFWWVFFTPGWMPRYMWMSLATAGMFGGALLWNVLVEATDTAASDRKALLRRFVWFVVALVIALPGAIRVGAEYRRVCTWDEMGSDYAAAEYVRNLPPEVRVTTTWNPLVGILLLLADRPADTLEVLSNPVPPNMVIFVDDRTQKEVAAGRSPTVRLGHYSVFAGSLRNGRR